MSRLSESIGSDSTDSVSEWLFDMLPERGDPTWYVLGLAFLLFVGFSIYTSLLNARFASTGADLGSYVHMFATTLQGEGWLLQGKYRVSHPYGSYWGAHFSLTLLVFLPLFALVPSVYTLLVAKSFVLAASVVILWLLAREYLESDRLAGLVTVSYAFNPFLWSAWSFDFQEQILIPPLMFAAYYCYIKKHHLTFLGFLTLVLFTNEFVIFVVAGFAVGMVIKEARAGRLRQKGPAILCIFILVAITRAIAGYVTDYYTQFSGLPSYVVADPFQPFIEGARVSFGNLLSILLSNPLLIFDALAVETGEKALFFAMFMLPVLFLALLDERSLGALAPYLGFAWVFAGETKEVYWQFGAHYPLYLLPFVYIGAMGALKFFSDRFEITAPSRATFAGVLSAILVLCLVAGVVTGGGHLRPVPEVNDEHRDILQEAIDSIPENATLITQNNIYPHVATRPNAKFIVSLGTFNAYERRYGPITPEYILIDTKLSPTAPWARVLQSAFADALGDEYGLYAFQDGIYIYRYGYNGSVHGITQPEPGTRYYDAADLSAGTGTLTNGKIVSTSGQPGDYIWFGPYVTLSEGTYTATYRVKVSGSGSEPVLTVGIAAGKDHTIIDREQVNPTDGWQNITVQFTLEETKTDVEFRGIRQGKGRIALDWVRVEYGADSTMNTTQLTARTEDKR